MATYLSGCSSFKSCCYFWFFSFSCTPYSVHLQILLALFWNTMLRYLATSVLLTQGFTFWCLGYWRHVLTCLSPSSLQIVFDFSKVILLKHVFPGSKPNFCNQEQMPKTWLWSIGAAPLHHYHPDFIYCCSSLLPLGFSHTNLPSQHLSVCCLFFLRYFSLQCLQVQFLHCL